MAQAKVTIRDVSERCGVSTATVSRVLNNTGRFSEETRKKVQQAVRELGYIPDASAKALRTKSTRLVGIFVNLLNYQMTATIVTCLQQKLLDAGYVSVVCNVGMDPSASEAYFDRMLSMNVCGVMVVALREPIAIPQDYSIPVVFLYRDAENGYSGEKVCLVETDDFQAGCLAGEELIGLGLRNISEVRRNRRNNGLSQRRHEGLVHALTGAGLQLNGEASVLSESESFADLLSAADRVLDAHPAAEGYFCASDLAALALIRSLETHGYRVPEDVKVIGCNDMQLALYNNKTITTIRHETDGICGAAVDRLNRMLAGEEIPEEERRTVLGVSLVKRETT